jgi:hypothetical protein
MSLQQCSIDIIKGGLFKWVQDNEDAFTEVVLLGQITRNDDDMKKCHLVQSAQNIGMVGTVFEAILQHLLKFHC